MFTAPYVISSMQPLMYNSIVKFIVRRRTYDYFLKLFFLHLFAYLLHCLFCYYNEKLLGLHRLKDTKTSLAFEYSNSIKIGEKTILVHERLDGKYEKEGSNP